MIPLRWIKKAEQKDDFSPYSGILLNETELNQIKSFPDETFNKLLEITKLELGKKCLEGDISSEGARGAIEFAKYLRGYFNK